jgi:hypothetical protein
MSLLEKLKDRYKRHLDKRQDKKDVQKIIADYNLSDPHEQVRLVNEFTLIYQKKSTLNRKQRDIVRKKILFMAENKILEVK